MKCLAAMKDRALEKLAASGDKDAKAEMIKRGLAYCPIMMAEAAKKKRPFQHPEGRW